MPKPLIHAEKLAELIKLQSLVTDQRSGTIFCYLVRSKYEVMGHSITADGRSCGYYVLRQGVSQTDMLGLIKSKATDTKGIYHRTFSWRYPEGYEVVYLYDLVKSFNPSFQKAYQLYETRGLIADIERSFRIDNYSWKDDLDYSLKRKGLV